MIFKYFYNQLKNKEENILNKLYRSNTNKRLFGVCGGIADYFNVDESVVRLLVALFAIGTCHFLGIGILYLIEDLVLPVSKENEKGNKVG